MSVLISSDGSDRAGTAGHLEALRTGRGQVAIAVVTSCLLVALLLQPWRYSAGDVFAGGNDPLWQQAMFQVHGQAGIFGASDHLAWPLGADPWRLPQMGALIGAWAWVTVGWFGMSTAASVLWYLVVIAGLNAAAIVYFLRGIVGPRHPALVLALAISLSAATHGVAYQLNIASLFPVALALGVLVRLPTMSLRRRRASLGALVLVATVAPLWWIVVLSLLLPVMAVPWLVRRTWDRATQVAMVWGVLAVGLALQTVVFLIARSNGPGANETRAAWTSNAFFGHLSDLLIGSPLIESLFPGTVASLEPGSSLTHAFGLPMLFTAGLALTVLIAVPPRRLTPETDTSVLAAATIGTTLFWLGGGLGNLQAALAVLAGTVSPARTWLRMLAVLAILGAGWLVALARATGGSRSADAPVDRWSTLRRAWPSVVAIVLVLGLVGDLVTYDQPRFYRSHDEEPSAAGVVDFLRSERAPCPVAQLPNESMPDARIPAGIASDLKYHEMEPFVLDPDYQWTAGSYDERNPVHLATLDHVVTDADLPQLEDWGYCAILYDVAQGQRAIDRDADVEGREVSLTDQPSYRDGSYELYLLDPR